MLLSRFWYILLAITAAGCLGAALLGEAVINARSDEALTDTLRHDRALVDAMLRLEARSRLDRIAFMTVDNKLGALLKQAQDVTDEKKLRELNAATKEVLRADVNRITQAAASQVGAEAKGNDIDPDIVFALDGNGRIIAELGPLESNPPGASLATFPLVRRALQGYIRDDVWVYDRRVYRMAGRPVMSGSEYAGAIIHGYRLEKGLPEKLSGYLGGASVAFFFGTDVLGFYAPESERQAPQQAEIASAIGGVLADAKFKNGQPSELVGLQHGGRALFSPVTGSAAAAGVGYAIARPRKVLTSPVQLFQQASQDDVKALPLPLLAGGAVALSLIGLLFVYLERDRHLKALLGKTAELTSGERDRLVVTEWRGSYRTLADRINQAIDKEVERSAERAPTARKKANLDELLGPTAEASSTPFFGFAEDGAGEASAAPAASAKATAASPLPKPPQPPPRKPAPAPLPAALAEPAVSLQPPRSAQPPAPAKTFARSPVSLAASDDAIEFDEGAHFREVYDAYVATRKQCGESIDHLTFEKFDLTLRKTRDQLVEKQGAKFVRFSVQVKEGKAALKAQPVKR